MPRQSPDLCAISLFSGGGGFDLGVEAAGFTTLFATDIDPWCCATLEANKRIAAELGKPFLQRATIVQRCISELTADHILECIDRDIGEIDLVIGGPPCQSFSVIGRRNGRKDPRGELLEDYLRLLAELEPKAFIFENVKGIMSVEDRKLYIDLKDRLRRPKPGLCYELSEFCLDASDFGVPQKRERVFIVGSRAGRKIGEIPTVTGGSDKASCPAFAKRTVADAFRGLSPAGSEFPPNHYARRHSKRIAQRYGSLQPGERDPKTRINKLDLDRPGFTVVSGSMNSGGKGHIHPTEPREVTPRESARLQTFPDWWEFCGSQATHARRQIGNAVPSLMAAAVACEVRSAVFNSPYISIDIIIARLDQQHLRIDS